MHGAADPRVATEGVVSERIDDAVRRVLEHQGAIKGSWRSKNYAALHRNADRMLSSLNDLLDALEADPHVEATRPIEGRHDFRKAQ